MRVAPLLLLALVACGDVLGADFDRPAAIDTAKDGRLPVPASGECPPSFKRCGDQCARTDDAKFGCGAETCTPCFAPEDGAPMCVTALVCDFACAQGFEKKAGRCVGFRKEPTSASQVGFTGIVGSATGDVFAAANAPFTPTGILHRAPNGVWEPETLPINDRLIQGMSITPEGDLYASTWFSTERPTPSAARPLLHRSPNGAWEALSIGEPTVLDALSVYATSANDIYVAVETGVRHFQNGAWTEEPADVGGWAVLWGADPKNVFLITNEGKLLHRPSSGKWGRLALQTELPRLRAIAGRNAEDFYVVAQGGRVFHITSFTFVTEIPTLTSAFLNNVWVGEVDGRNDVWVSGGGLLLHAVDDSGFTRLSTAAGTIWGTGPDDLYLTSADATSSFILHRH